MGPEATVRQLAQRLRCSRCGNRQVGVTVHPDTRTAEVIERDGPAPEMRAGMPEYLMTEAEARVLLRRWPGLGGLEGWIAI